MAIQTISTTKLISLKIVLVFYLSLFSNFLISQNIFPESQPKVLPEKFKINLDMDSVHYYTIHKRDAKTNLDNSLLYINQFTKKDVFENGTIAYNYDIIEDYLNKIIQKITSEEFIKKYNIHVYPSKETEINAYAMYDGTILFNVHNFIYLNTEAEVAYILAHEIGHLIQDYKANYEWLDYMNSYDMFNDKKRKYEKASQNIEIDADNKAAFMLTASGYDNQSGFFVEQLFLNLETNLKNYNNYRQRRYLKTHPPSQERLDSLKEWVPLMNNGKNYLVDSLLFQKIKAEARIHSMKNNMESHSYFDCLELALEGYLSEGTNEQAYYIAESLRRLLYSKKFKSNKQIFSGIYKNMLSYNYLDKIVNGIYITPHNDTILQNLKKLRIYNTQKFFDYFLSIVPENEVPEILLTKGLNNYAISKGKKTDLLAQYISADGKHKLFIDELIHPSKYEQQKSLYVFNKVTAYNCESKKPIKLYFLEKDLTHQFDSLSNDFYMNKCPVEIKEHKSTQSLLDTDLQESIFLNNLSNLVSPLSKINQNLTILSPELGSYLAKNKYSSFQYVNFDYQVCVSAGATVAIIVLTGSSPTPTMFLARTIEYNKNKKTCIGTYNVNVGNLTLNAYKRKLMMSTLRSKHY